jgi:hypothetical protein
VLFCLFFRIIYFVHNVAATISYYQKEFLEIRTAITHLGLKEEFLFNESDKNNIQLVGFTLYRQDRTAASGKTRGDGLCIFVNNSWCTISKEV